MSEDFFTLRPIERIDREWIAHFMDQHWGTTQIVSRGKAVYGHLLPGFVAERPVEGDEEPDNEIPEDNDEAEDPVQPVKRIGLVTYNIEDNACEITTLNSLEEERGVGGALVDAVVTAMKEAKVKRIWLITTNDNLPALKFWQKRDFHLVTVHRDAIQEARRIKPQIPITGYEGIPIRDELELEMLL